MKPSYAATPARLSALALAALLCGCSTINDIFAGDKVDYRNNAATKGKSLEVPPDLTQLARESRFQTQGGVVSAAASTGAATRPGGPVASTAVAPVAQGEVRVERQGNQRWLVVPATPEKLWPQVKTFWEERGFALTTDNPETGLMETDWAENRSKLPTDVVRNTLGKVLGGLYDTGERDRYRTRLFRGAAAATEIYISHRGLEEVYTNERKDSTVWRPRANDPQLETQMLTYLMARLGAKEEKAAAAAVAAAVEQPVRARVVTGRDAATLEVDEPFDRAWRRVGLALDRSGFSVEDRDRTAGTYFVRYVDPKAALAAEPGFFSKLFSSATPTAPVKYRISVVASGDKTLVSVLSSSGAPEGSETGQRIVSLLVGELK